ncbi:hypothetical protein V6N11_070212 [Hibiscus sabdariffa]|uniref:Uncharacterized protein n=1 Tax=Hibiscus sabdariffa TaxID=183260 RepID=A0ABR2QES0_9ROSI
MTQRMGKADRACVWAGLLNLGRWSRSGSTNGSPGSETKGAKFPFFSFDLSTYLKKGGLFSKPSSHHLQPPSARPDAGAAPAIVSGRCDHRKVALSPLFPFLRSFFQERHPTTMKRARNPPPLSPL